MIDLAFVVLHYNTIDNTIECISSIRNNLKGKKYHIIIVDNASPNGSYKNLSKMYDKDEDITLIYSERNLGFAKGNNLGYKYAKEQLKAKFIALINNDIKILQNDFIEKVALAYEKERFYVMGPLILTADGRYTSNPVRLKLITKEEVELVIHHYKKELIYYKLNLLWLQEIFHKVKYLIKRNKKNEEIDYLKVYKNVELHGCFLILSPLYIERYEGLDNRTFMYEEERILYKHMMDEGGLMLYNPEIIVFHKEGATTSSINKKNKEQKKFLWENSLNSAYILRSLFQDE